MNSSFLGNLKAEVEVDFSASVLFAFVFSSLDPKRGIKKRLLLKGAEGEVCSLTILDLTSEKAW